MSRIPVHRGAGRHSRQAHADLPAGTYEREFGSGGFFGPATQIHHAHPPTGWSAWDGPLRPRAFDLTRIEAPAPSPLDAATILANHHCGIRFWRCDRAMTHLVRNADGDDLLFVHEGGGDLFCDFGHLALRDGDYVLLPRGTMWRLEPAPAATLLLIEATGGGYRLPERGMLGQQALFDPMMLDVPEIDDAFRAQQDEREWSLHIRRGAQVSVVTYPYNPLDAVGWHGDLTPVRLNWRDIRPVMSPRFHLPPSVHTTFLADRFVVCTFVPRPLESDPGALKLPFYHSNNDFDEVLFYHRGNFMSRDNIHAGMMTFHPAGFPHGPHPKAFQAAEAGTRTETDEVAVMIDTRDALEPSDQVARVEWPGYVDSWKG